MGKPVERQRRKAIGPDRMAASCSQKASSVYIQSFLLALGEFYGFFRSQLSEVEHLAAFPHEIGFISMKTGRHGTVFSS